ncbi:hypothetical protein GCM10010468_40280 [Actinocorallia longicatena]|uniref:Ricin B lectin domain-containing protein n=2 Tax=Actinocorallia longicatena TaxID=111803 RepID=A0ABP6QBX6_9ACTN
MAVAGAFAGAVIGCGGAADAAAAAAGPGPFYWIVGVNSGKVLMPSGQSKAYGEQIVQAGQGDLGAQHWKILGSGNGRKLYNRHSHLCIVAPATGSAAYLRQEGCDGNSGDPSNLRPVWTVSDYDAMWAGSPVTWQSPYSFHVMDVYQARLDDGAPLIQYPYTGGTNQQFYLKHVPGT